MGNVEYMMNKIYSKFLNTHYILILLLSLRFLGGGFIFFKVCTDATKEVSDINSSWNCLRKFLKNTIFMKNT